MLAYDDIYAHKNRKPFGSSKKMLAFAYGLQDATVLSKGSPFLGEEVEGTTKIAHMQTFEHFF